MQHFFEGVGKARFYRAIKKSIPLKFFEGGGEKDLLYYSNILTNRNFFKRTTSLFRILVIFQKYVIILNSGLYADSQQKL